MEQITGYVDHIIYRKAENGYTVFVLVSEEDEITCVGNMTQIDQGDYLQIEGEEVSHAIYGSQIKIKSYRIVPPSDAESMERYLGSGAIKGVGPAHMQLTGNVGGRQHNGKRCFVGIHFGIEEAAVHPELVQLALGGLGIISLGQFFAIAHGDLLLILY